MSLILRSGGAISGAALLRQATALWSMGPDITLNPAAKWPTAPANLLVDSEDMTGAEWAEAGSGAVDDATHFTFAAQFDVIYQLLTAAAGENVTFYFRGRQITGNTSLLMFYDGVGAGSTGITLTGTAADYAVTVIGDGGEISFGVMDANASGWGQIEVNRWAIFPGTHTAEECAALYEKVGGDRQLQYDWGKTHAYPLTVGSTSGPDSNDPVHLIESNNLLAPGSATDLTNAAWLENGTASVTDADTVALPAEGDSINQVHITSITPGMTFIFSAYLKGTVGQTATLLLKRLSGGGFESSSLPVTLTADYTRYVVSHEFVGTQTSLSIQIGREAGQTATSLDATNIMLEQVPAGTTTPLPFEDSAEPGFKGAHAKFDGVEDESNSAVTTAADKTVLVLYRQDVAAAAGILQDSGGSPAVRVLSGGELSYVEGLTVSSTAVVGTGLWAIGAVVTKAGTAQLYVDGVKDNSSAVTGIGFSDVQLGRDLTTYFNGPILLVAIWSKALSDEDIVVVTKTVAQEMWDYRGIPCYGVAGVDIS